MRTLPLEVRHAFAVRLRQAMKLRGFWDEKADEPTATRFADAFGFSQQQVSRWLGGQIPSFIEGLRLARALNVNAEWLCSGEGDLDRPTVAPLRSLLAALAVGAGLLGLSPSPAIAGVPARLAPYIFTMKSTISALSEAPHARRRRRWFYPLLPLGRGALA